MLVDGTIAPARSAPSFVFDEALPGRESFGDRSATSLVDAERLVRPLIHSELDRSCSSGGNRKDYYLSKKEDY